MKEKEEIVKNWLPRYTGVAIEAFGKYILLTNFQTYVEKFAEMNGVEVKGKESSMSSATAGDITALAIALG